VLALARTFWSILGRAFGYVEGAESRPLRADLGALFAARAPTPPETFFAKSNEFCGCHESPDMLPARVRRRAEHAK
jgi:hypothetical protein